MKKIIEYIKNNKDRNYTFKEIAADHYEVWLAVPAILFILTPVIKFLAFSYVVNIHPIANEETYLGIVLFVTMISLIPGIIGVMGYRFKSGHISLSSEIRRNIAPVFFACLCVLSVISTCLYTLKDEPEIIIQSLFQYLSYFILYYYCSQLITGQRIKKIIIDLILIISIFAGAIELIDLFIWHIPSLNYTGVTSVFIHANHYGYFLTIPILLSLSMFIFSNEKASEAFYIFSFLFNSLMLALSNTFGAFLGVVVALAFMIVVYYVKRGRLSLKVLIPIAAFFVVCFIVGLKFPSFFSDLVVLKKDIVNVVENNEAQNTAGSGRWNLWRRTFELIAERPLLGWGLNGVFEQLAAVEQSISKPHNEYLETAVFYGIPAAIAYIAGLLAVFIKALKNRKTIDDISSVCLIASLAYIGSAFFGNVKFYTAPFFFIVLGLASRYETSE